MSPQPLTTEIPSFLQIRDRMIRDLESFLAATLHLPVSQRLIPHARAVGRPARYHDIDRNHVARGENQPC